MDFFVKSVEPSTAAFNKVSVGATVSIAENGNTVTVTVDNSDWSVEGTSNGNNVILGRIEGPYCFVICRGKKKIVGLVYSEVIGQDDDPGTWEADESGGGPSAA